MSNVFDKAIKEAKDALMAFFNLAYDDGHHWPSRMYSLRQLLITMRPCMEMDPDDHWVLVVEVQQVDEYGLPGGVSIAWHEKHSRRTTTWRTFDSNDNAASFLYKLDSIRYRAHECLIWDVPHDLLVLDPEIHRLRPFSAEVQGKLDQFHELKLAAVNGEPPDEEGLARVASELVSMGYEMTDVIRHELNELEHRQPGFHNRILSWLRDPLEPGPD